MSDDPLPASMPRNEFATLDMSVIKADDLIRDGEPPNSYRCQFGGMERAQETLDDGSHGARSWRHGTVWCSIATAGSGA
jgi:hypothetical protein